MLNPPSMRLCLGAGRFHSDSDFLTDGSSGASRARPTLTLSETDPTCLGRRDESEVSVYAPVHDL
jgi:hypothetical protein